MCRCLYTHHETQWGEEEDHDQFGIGSVPHHQLNPLEEAHGLWPGTRRRLWKRKKWTKILKITTWVHFLTCVFLLPLIFSSVQEKRARLYWISISSATGHKLSNLAHILCALTQPVSPQSDHSRQLWFCIPIGLEWKRHWWLCSLFRLECLRASN